MTSRREFIKTGAAASALIAAPAILRAQTREPFVMMTPFGFIADFIEMMNAISGGHMAAQGLDAAAPDLDRLIGPETLLVSVLAGKTVANLRGRLPAAQAVVRAMPNLPASIGRGATGAFANHKVTPGGRASADALLSAAGTVAWLDDEDAVDAVTAVSGSGPAYVFLMVETLAEAGVAAGLPPDVAGRLARATVAGAGALLDADPAEAGALRQAVTSPGGTTAAALSVLMAEDGLAPLMRRAVAAAKRRAGELSG